MFKLFGRSSGTAATADGEKRDVTVAPKNKQWVTGQDGLDKLKLSEEDTPKPKDGEVLVKIGAVSLNYRDIEVCTGTYGHHPSLAPGAGTTPSLVPCSDMCGVVVESRSDLLKPGARVMSIFNQSHLEGPIREEDLETGLGFPLPGVLAQYRCFKAECLVEAPKHLSDQEAACLPIAAVTAWMCINGMRPLRQPRASGDKDSIETVLVQGTGGVATAALQIAKAAGLSVIVTSSSDAKLDRATKHLHADGTVNYRTHWEWQDPVLDMTPSRRGVDLIIETGGARTLRKSFQCVRFGGTIACVGYVSGKGEEEDRGDGGINRMNVNVLALRRCVTLRGVLNGSKESFEDMAAFYEEKGIKPVVGKTFAFDEAKEALKFLNSGEHFGKVVIQVAE